MTPAVRPPIRRPVAFASVCLSLSAAVAQSPPGAPAAAAAWEPPAPAAVMTRDMTWRDEKRERDVPVRLYLPQPTSATALAEAMSVPPAQRENGSADASAAHPVLLFSHGLGGTREAAAYLGEYWAAHGYISVHMQHPGSDDAAWKGKRDVLAAMRAAANGASALNRALDERFVIDTLAALNVDESSPLCGRLDLERIGMAGHSFGAHTTLTAAGRCQPRRFSKPVMLNDERISAAVALSPAPSRARDQRAAHEHIRIPMLHMTGTEDRSVINDTTPQERRIPFDMIEAPDQYLVIFDGGDHMVFSGREPRFGDTSRYEQLHVLIRQATLAFWEAHLRGDERARAWLSQGGFAKALGDLGTLEVKSDDAG